MKSYITLFAFLFLLGWLFAFFLLQSGMMVHLLLLASVALVLFRLRSQHAENDESSAA